MTDEGLCPRTARAAVFTAACVLLSAVTYAVVGHGAAPLWAVLIALAAVYPLAWIGSARTSGIAGICVFAGVVQLGLDYWFSLAQLNETVIRGCGLIQALPPMGETLSCARTAGAEPVALNTDGTLRVGLMLLLVQLAVALASAVFLASGERAQVTLRQRLAESAPLGTLVRRWWPILTLALTRLAPPAPASGITPPRATSPVRPKRLDLRHAVIRRGPPATSRAALALG